MKKSLLSVIVCFASLHLYASGVLAADVCVDNPSALQGALNTAESNDEADTIKVVEGYYYREANEFSYNSAKGHSLTLLGGYTSSCNKRIPDSLSTILDGTNSSRALNLKHSAGGDITVDGFTIQTGNTTGDGGGVYIESSSESETAGNITLSNNIIRENNSDNGGGGVYARSYSTSGDSGNVVLINNIISGNEAATGGGIFASSYTPGSGSAGIVTITNNTIAGNTAVTNGGGAFIYSYNGPPTDSGTLNCYNNIIWGNSGETGPDIYVQNRSGATTYGYNNDYSHIYGTWDYGNETNIDQDPQFADEYFLTKHSPCIDAGINSAPSIPEKDIQGDPRIAGDVVDMGADEYVLTGIVSQYLLLLLN